MAARRGRCHGEEEERGRDGFNANGGVKDCLINGERKVMEGGTVCVCVCVSVCMCVCDVQGKHTHR